MAMKVAVVAFGTRGDVQPLVILAAGLAARSTWCKEVVFLTHQLHAVWVESLLKLSAGTEHCGDDLAMPQLATVDSPPVMWKGQSIQPCRLLHVVPMTERTEPLMFLTVHTCTASPHAVYAPLCGTPSQNRNVICM